MTPSPRTTAAAAGPAAPRHPGLWAALTYALATLTLAWPVLGGAFLINPRSDQYTAGFPFRDFATQSLKAGQGIPQWNPYLFGGMPYVAAMHGDMFYPTALLRLLFSTQAGMSWGLVLHVFLAGCFTYGFLRAWGLGFYSALVGGLAYMLGGNLAGLVSPGHDGKLFVSALMPLALWMLVRGVRDGRRWAWGGLALAVGLAVLSPHPQLLQYMLLTCGGFGAFLAFSRNHAGVALSRRVALQRLGLALAAVAVGFAIGAIQFLPVMEYVAWSPRSGGKGYEYATSFSLPFEELFDTYLPQFSGILDNYWGRNTIHLHSEYIGAVVLMLASAAVGAGEHFRTFRRFWFGALAVALLWALGGNTPFYVLVYAVVPGAKFFRAPSTILMVVAMCTSVLAALGTERLLAGAVPRRLVIGWIAAAAAIALLASAGALTSVAQSIASGFAGSQLDERIAANQGALIVGAWRSFLFVALAGAVLLASAHGRLDARRLAWALALLVTVDLWSVGRNYWQYSPPASEIYATDPAIEFLRSAPPGRVIATPFAEQGYVPRDPNFIYDGLMVHGIRLATGYHGNEIGRYRLLGSPDGADRYPNQMNPSFWRLANVRYLYTDTGISQPGFTQLVGPVKSARGSTVYLYRLPGDNPPAWVAPVMVKAGDEATLGTILDPRFDPLRAAIVDSASAVGATAITALPAPVAVTPSVTKFAPGHIALALSAPAPAGSALVVSENYYPGWSASVDGRAVAPVRTDFNLIGIPLPAGARQVQLDFADRAYETGKLVTILATLLAVAAAAGGALMERRRRAA